MTFASTLRTRDSVGASSKMDSGVTGEGMVIDTGAAGPFSFSEPPPQREPSTSEMPGRH